METLCALDGEWETVFPKAQALAKNDAMREALRELENLSALNGSSVNLRLNLSLVNDLEYYNGLVLQGFLEGIPRPVLRG